ncbi:MAG: hypothetical protein LBI27_10515 [Clostridiales bacterium]|jgi:hypothetical protein|nr:hypothetical protein [Clostridiales bacterium]
MDSGEIARQAVKFKTARANLLLVVVFTTINVFLAFSEAGVYLLFSAMIPLLILELAQIFAFELGNDIFTVFGLVGALIAIGAYLLCWALSKNAKFFMVIALIFFSIETLVFAVFFFLGLAGGGFEGSMIIEIAFHGWILYYLVTGTLAWLKLRHTSPEEIGAAHSNLENYEKWKGERSAVEDFRDDDGF